MVHHRSEPRPRRRHRPVRPRRGSLRRGDRPRRSRVENAIGAHENLLALALDVTDPDAAEAAAAAAVERFGRIDVLVNNAGNFYAGYFENISPAQFRAQMETNFFGPLNVTRAMLPVMRKQRSGQVITVTSAAGLMGQEFCRRVRRVEVRARGLDGVAAV